MAKKKKYFTSLVIPAGKVHWWRKQTSKLLEPILLELNISVWMQIITQTFEPAGSFAAETSHKVWKILKCNSSATATNIADVFYFNYFLFGSAQEGNRRRLHLRQWRLRQITNDKLQTSPFVLNFSPSVTQLFTERINSNFSSFHVMLYGASTPSTKLFDVFASFLVFILLFFFF